MDSIEAKRELYKALHALADELDCCQRKLDIAKLSFSVTGAAGGIISIVGLCLAPATCGASLLISGGVIAGLSAVGTIISIIAENELKREAKAKLLALDSEDASIRLQLKQLNAKLNGIKIGDMKLGDEELKKNNKSKPRAIFDWFKNKLKKRWQMVSSGFPVFTLGRIVADVFETASALFNGIAKSVSVAAFTFAGIGLIPDLLGILIYIWRVHKGKPCAVSQDIRKVAESLKED